MQRGAARTTAAIVVAALAALPAPASAAAGAYRVAICNPALGAHHGDAAFERTTRHYVSEASCGSGRPGLSVHHEAERTSDGRWGGWTVRAPRGTVFAELSLGAAGRRAGGHLPQLLAAAPGGALRPFATPDPGIERLRFAAPARTLSARLSCTRADGCRRGRKARIRIKRLALRLADRVPPTIALSGSAFGSGSRRGIQTVKPSGTDLGGGIRRFLLQVNGEPITAQGPRCRTNDGFALRLRPCPAAARTTFGVQTASVPFRQGPNVVRVCSADFALGTGANRTCRARRIRVDNLCPISDAGAGSRLEARLTRPRAKGAAASVRGRVRSARGVPVADARVCVATRVPIAGARERVVTTPSTGPDGRFAARLPKGPSRRVRVAYWWSAQNVAERHLSLRVRARPRLRLRPRQPIHNGHRVRFKVRLRGPAAAHRWVRIQARSGGRWIELRNGRTNRAGTSRARYRFHATTGRRRYRFRAFVPGQRGYPYRAGHSAVGHVTVVG